MTDPDTPSVRWTCPCGFERTTLRGWDPYEHAFCRDLVPETTSRSKRNSSTGNAGRATKKTKTSKGSTRASLNDGDSAPYWQDALTAVYDLLPLPAMTASADSGLSPSSGSSSKDAEWSCWCSRALTPNAPLQSPSSPRTSWRSCMSFPQGALRTQAASNCTAL